MMGELLDHCRSQTTAMASMEREMAGMREEVKRVRDDMKNLSDKHDLIEAPVRTKTAETSCTRMSDDTESIDVEDLGPPDPKRESSIREFLETRFGDVDARLRYHEMMLRNQRWEYSAPSICNLYQLDINNQAQAQQARNFLEQIERETRKMRYGKQDSCSTVSLEANVLYHDYLRVHWEEFANALGEHHLTLKCADNEFSSKSLIELYDVEIPNNIQLLLSMALRKTHFTSIYMRNNNFGNGIKFPLHCMMINPILEALHLCNSPINDQADVDQLSKIIKRHPSIEKVEIIGCNSAGTIDCFGMLRSIISAGSEKLKDVDLSSNDISTEGNTFISEFLAKNPILERLVLQGSQLNDYDAISIARALKHNTNLMILDLQENPVITQIGAEALHRAEFDDTSLNSASDSNHTCEIYHDGEVPTTNVEFGHCRLRSKKIYSMLSSRNRSCSNVQYLDEVPIETLPELISSIQEHSGYFGGHDEDQDANDVTPLSIVYEIMRKWDEAFSVYESLGTAVLSKQRTA